MAFMQFLTGKKRPSSSSVARDRLQIILAHERVGSGPGPEYLPRLKQELMEVIARYIQIKPEDIRINMAHQDTLEVLEVKIEMPGASA